MTSDPGLSHAAAPFTVAHLSDLHLGNRPEAWPRAVRVLAHVVAMNPPPDLLLVTGDVADHGLTAEYVSARELLSTWPGPTLVGPGNHDVREPFARELLGTGSDSPLNQELVVGGFRFLMLDSLVPAVDGTRIDHGELAATTLGWLDERLSASTAPTFVCLHHPPVTVNIRLMDSIQLHDPEGLEQVLVRHPQVVAVLVGHDHSACASTFAGRPVLVGGGVTSSVPLDAEPLPELWNDAPPTLAFHQVDAAGRLTTHWRSLV